MTELTAARSMQRDWTLVALIAIPIVCAVAGLVIRYFAYLSIIPDGDPAHFPMGLCRWDCGWYVHIAEVGYDDFPTPKLINAGNWAFFPLFPMMVAAVRMVFGLPTMFAATGLSIVIAMGACWLAWPLLERRMGAYLLFCAYLLCGPFSIYFVTFYTEVLFLFLTVAVFAALRVRRFLLAGVLAALLSATRIVGVFIVFAILLEMYFEHRERGGMWRDFVPRLLMAPERLLALAISPLGLFAYMAYLYFKVGDSLAFAHVQRAWGRPFGNPIAFVWEALTSFPGSGFTPTTEQILGLATVVGYALCAVLLVRRRHGMALFSLISLTLPLFAGMASMLRFVAGLAPMPLALADLAGRSRIAVAIGLLLLLVGGYFTTIGWINGYLALV